ncbi:hypothetical protein LUZ60_002781 [Juncus effusus]|nr:hypothetical protein LUZ60_002781 [Juncus effusus]
MTPLLLRFLPLVLLLLFLSATASAAPGCNHDHHHHGHEHEHEHEIQSRKLPEELAEEMDLALESHDFHHEHEHEHYHEHGHESEGETSALGLWLRAMGCSLLVSMASLICLILLPVILFQGKPSKTVVDSLALFGAGAMLGDAFLHQLPHAFGGGHSHSHGHDDHSHAHAHSLEDLYNGLSVLFGIVLFFLVEKIVRYVEDNSTKHSNSMVHAHHNHSHKKHNNDINNDDSNEEKTDDKLKDGKTSAARKRSSNKGKSESNNSEGETVKTIKKEEPSSPSNLVFGYLNLFSDGVHNFTDGMALGSAFLLHGSVGGWSRTLFLLAHELPQEVGDFGILVRSGFTVSKALFFNFLSALVALAGTALALVLGKDPGHSSLIEGFTAGGFIYIAVAGVLPQMNEGKTTVKSTAIQLTFLLLGMLVALCISLVE